MERSDRFWYIVKLRSKSAFTTDRYAGIQYVIQLYSGLLHRVGVAYQMLLVFFVNLAKILS
jgi:hypothetical protein